MDSPLQMVDRLLAAPCFLLDSLPEQVPADGTGQYFAVEQYFLEHPELLGLERRFTCALLKLMCYYHVILGWCGWHDQPSPDRVAAAIDTVLSHQSGTIQLLFPEDDALLVLDGGDLYLSVYHPNAGMQQLLQNIARTEGLYWREGAPAPERYRVPEAEPAGSPADSYEQTLSFDSEDGPAPATPGFPEEPCDQTQAFDPQNLYAPMDFGGNTSPNPPVPLGEG